MIKEIPLKPFSGWLILPVQLIALPVVAFGFFISIQQGFQSASLEF